MPEIRGERGPTGDHGQAGDEGRTGPQGPQGLTGKTEPVTIWFGINRWTWAFIAFLFIVGVGGYTTWQIDQRFEQQVDDLERLTLQQDYKSCLNQNANAQKIREVLMRATDPKARLDVTTVPGFEPLPPNIKLYLNNLEVAQVTRLQAASSNMNRSIAEFPPRKCEEEYSKVDHVRIQNELTNGRRP